MPKVSGLKLSKSGSNKFDDLRFRLSYIGNISVKSEGNFYEVLFNSINARSDFQIVFRQPHIKNKGHSRIGPRSFPEQSQKPAIVGNEPICPIGWI